MPPETFTHDSYLSPFTWRYGSAPMRHLWGEHYKRRLWRRIWVALAEAQQHVGLVTAEQVADLRKHAEKINIARAHEIEAEISHDLMAEVRTFAEQARTGGPIIHLGATSMDIEDNADALRLRDALALMIGRVGVLLDEFATQIERWAERPTMAFTHLQPAEPTTVGYRLAQYAQDLMMDLSALRAAHDGIRGKGFKGAVGTSASYAQLLEGQSLSPRELEGQIMSALGLGAFEATTQTYPRKQDWIALTALAGVAGTLYKVAFDLRLLQSPPIGEWAEPFGARQVGSSAMPFKRNPIHAEKVDSLARFVATLPDVAWHNAAHSLLERTLDDSANRRLILPEAFLATEEVVTTLTRLVGDLQVREEAIQRNLEAYGPFAATERLLMEAVKAGADRQKFHELIRGHAMEAWAALTAGEPNPLVTRLLADREVTRYLPAERARTLLDASDYSGDAAERARAIAAQARAARTGTILLVGERLYATRNGLLSALDLTTGQEVVHEAISAGPIQEMLLTPDGSSLVIRFEPQRQWRGIANVVRLTLDGAEEWRAEMPETVRPRGYQRLSREGDRLVGHAFPLDESVNLSWESGLIEEA